MKTGITFLLLSLFFTFNSLHAQLLNSDFESWTSGDPTDWFTSDISGIIDAVTQSGSAYHGTSCAKLEVKDFSGTPYPPYLTTYNPSTQMGHPVTEKNGSLHGYYKCNPLGNDQFIIGIAMNVGQSNIVGAGAGIFGSASSWTEFNVAITYSPGSSTPDNAIIYFVVGDTSSGGTATVGSEAYIDFIDLTAPSGVERINGLPSGFSLSQNYPNPFNPSTKIEYSIPEESFVQLKVYDVLGNEVATIVNEEQNAGTYRADFSGSNLASGLYIAQIKAGNFTKAIKMSLMK